jgi:putative two-component system response regulator
MSRDYTISGSYLDAIASSFTVLVATADDDLYGTLYRSLVPFGYRVVRARDGKAALDRCRAEPPDLIAAEGELDVLSGFELCRALKRQRETRIIPFVLVTSFFDVDQKIKALQVGADDFLYRPVHQAELRARIRSLLRIKAFYARIESERAHLDRLAQRRTRELDELTIGLITALEKANSLNDEDTGGHIKRVCHYSYVLGRAVGLSEVFRNKLRRYASLHDVGKVGLPDRILKKRGRLTPTERKEMERHTILGAELLTAAKVDPVAVNIALTHHEKYDGSGYPRGLRAEQIPIEGRILALADVFDALTTRRCYKEAMPIEEARELITGDAGRHFDPGIVQAFEAQIRAFRDIHATYRDDNVTRLEVAPALDETSSVFGIADSFDDLAPLDRLEAAEPRS